MVEAHSSSWGRHQYNCYESASSQVYSARVCLQVSACHHHIQYFIPMQYVLILATYMYMMFLPPGHMCKHY